MSAYVRIDLEDYVSELDDETIRDEFERRKLHIQEDPCDLSEVMLDAYEELLRGRPTEARAVLERVLYPKWRTEQQCRSEHAAMTYASRAASGGPPAQQRDRNSR